jgi:hypothetical protein
MIKKFIFVCVVVLLAACDQDPGYIAKPNLKAEEFAVKKSITASQFKQLKEKVKRETDKGKNTILIVVHADNLKDEDFNGLEASMLRISRMPHITNKAFDTMALQHMLVEDCPSIDENGLKNIKGLKSVQLWNMPHITDENARVLLKKQIKVYDYRKEKDKKLQIQE